MKKQMITKTIRRIYIAKLIPAFLFLIFIGYLLYQYPFKDILFPTRLHSVNALLSVDKSNQEFIEVTVPTLYYTGYDDVKNSKRIGSYYYTFLDDTCVFFLLSNKADRPQDTELSNITLKAKQLKDTSRVNELREYLATDLLWTKEALTKISYDYLISEPDAFYMQGYFLLAFIVLTGCYSIVTVISSIFFMIAPFYSPFCKFMAPGNKRMALNIAEFEYSSNRFFHCNKTTITPNYIIELYTYKVDVIPLEQIIWIFKHSTISRFNGISYHLVIYTTYGKLKIKNKQKFEADSVLAYLNDCPLPILIGYSKENEKQAKEMIKNRKLYWVNRLKEG
ncbi:DUF6709 family protein [Candidatus Galacturonibacter soehngenii]|uniref:Uncharacterized protein n=1 Tax=Candidatus Galacturonatibacter soehngenii TaxID=2307010 RepID=A0A7V7QK41_9FIRM|nr:DUF6709 family protein [Candidatus Galacturonibacter soehngenii]KAB1438112.1 hypothetical protein F7O84_11165 [Candidatus Galacturonibacter soehngenii]